MTNSTAPIQKTRLTKFLALAAVLQGPSDQLAVIRTTSALDKSLEELLDAHGIKPKKKKPGFHDRIELALASGLLHGDDAAAFQLLRPIRNDAAHEDDDLDLATRDGEIRAIAARIDPSWITEDFDPKVAFRRFALLGVATLRWQTCMVISGVALVPVTLGDAARALAAVPALIFVGVVIGGILLVAAFRAQRGADPVAQLA